MFGSPMAKLSNSPSILIVDDEELMREVTSIMVEDNGGSVISAASGDEAIQLIQNEKPQIDCVVLDFSMPGRNGYETFLELDRLIPGIPCIVISGLACTPEMKVLVDSGRVQFLSKPFQEAALIEAILSTRKPGV